VYKDHQVKAFGGGGQFLLMHLVDGDSCGL
jgi:hypothetical protein